LIEIAFLRGILRARTALVDAVNYGQIIVATVKEMRATAKARGVKAYYKMNKSQLERAIGATDTSKRSAPGNKRAQATARKSGAATSFGAEKLAAKYGVEKQDLVKGAKKALRQAEKAKGGKLTPQEKRKAVAASLSAQTKIDRSTAGMIRSMKRNDPDAYEKSAQAFADMPFRKVRKKAAVMFSAIEKKAKGKSKKTTQPTAVPTSRPPSKRNRIADEMMEERMTNGKTPRYRDMESKLSSMSSFPSRRLKARIKRTTETRLGDRLASARQKEGNPALTIKDARRSSRQIGLSDGQSIISKPKAKRVSKRKKSR
jgi:hypothetical protein